MTAAESPSPQDTPDEHPRAAAYPGPGGAVWLLILFIFASIAFSVIVRIFGLEHIPPIRMLAEAALPGALVAWYAWRRWAAPASELLVLPRIGPVAIAALAATMIAFWIVLFQGFALLTMAMPIPEALLEVAAQRAGGPWPVLAIVLVIAATSEEVLFRGVILAGFLERYAAAPAVIFSALIFGLAHVVPWAIFGSFMGGLLLGWIYLRTRSILLCSAVHLVHNLGADYFARAVRRLAGLGDVPVNQPVEPLLPLEWFVAGLVLLAAGAWVADARLRRVQPPAGPRRPA